MKSWNDKIYTIDGEPASPNEIIAMAREIDANYDKDWFKTTSRGAEILRKHGHKVSDRIFICYKCKRPITNSRLCIVCREKKLRNKRTKE